MAEYGSGIFYGRCNSYQSLSTFSQLGLLSLPSELDLGPPITNISKNVEVQSKDMILLAEFSEIEGPIPLLSIPHSNTLDINLNDFVLQLMSTDYQNMGNSGFQIFKDTCLLQEDSEKMHYTYVHYFTLYDVTARGFVRPMCLAYFSNEPEKLRRYFKHIKEDFRQFTEYLRVYNLNYFSKEINQRIADLHYTKERFIYSQEQPPKEAEAIPKKIEKINETKSFNQTKRKRASSFNNDLSRPLPPAHLRNTGKSYSLDREGDLYGSPVADNIDSSSPSHRLLRLSYSFRSDSVLSSSLPPYSAKSTIFSPITVSSRKDTLTLSSHIKPPFRPYLSNKLSHQRNTSKDLSKDLGPDALSYSSDSSTSTIKSSRAGFYNPSREEVISPLTRDATDGNQMLDLEEASVLQHTNLDALAVQLLDCQYILEVVKDYLRLSETTLELKKFLQEVKSNSQSPLYKAMEELNLLGSPTEGPEPKQPTLFVISLLRRNYRNMRSVQDLCGIGYIVGLSKLLDLYQRYSKPTLTLLFEDLDKELYENPFSTLFMGTIPIISLGKELNSNAVPRVNKSSFSEACWNEDLVRLLHVDLSKDELTDSNDLDIEKTGHQDHVAVADDCLEVFAKVPSSNDEVEAKSHFEKAKDEGNFMVSENEWKSVTSSAPVTVSEGRSLSRMGSTCSDLSWASSTPRDFASIEGSDQDVEEDGEEELVFDVLNKMSIKMVHHDIDKRMETGKLYHMTSLIQQFSGVYQCVIHSILSGRTVVVASPEHLKSAVMLYTKTLSTILPVKPNEVLPVLKWHTGTITPHHLKMYKIIGTCIPERLHVQDLMSNATLNQVTVLNIESGHISGVAYSGALLRKTDQLTRRYYRSDLSLQATLQSILVGVGMKVFLHFHLRKTTSRTSSEILKGIGVPRGDWLMIEHLSQLMNESISDVSHTT